MSAKPMKEIHPQAPSGDSSPDLARLIDLVSAFSRQTIVVVGDFVVDEFVSGEISRVSREAPVLILRHRKTEVRPGGGANAVNNLVDLGARVRPVGAVGDDVGGRDLLDYFRGKGVETSGIMRVPGWTTPTKSRFFAGWTHTTEQQVLRVDREPASMLSKKRQRSLAQKVGQRLRGASACLISDYGFGAATPELAAKLRSPIVTLDSRYSLGDYRKAGITAATPNEAELESLFHTRIGNDTERLEGLGKRTLKEFGFAALLVTRGKDGMALFERGNSTRHIPIHGSDETVDVTGAGDTVIAVFTLALAAGATCLEAAHIANYAGGIVVMKRRTATVTRAELEGALRAEVTAAEVNPG
ncbi:MAG: PfkB family carbohydrate kinase [Candidatus Acidiferrales bacterium]